MSRLTSVWVIDAAISRNRTGSANGKHAAAARRWLAPEAREAAALPRVRGAGRPRAHQPPREAEHATERHGMALFSNLLSRIWGQAETATPPAASTEGAPTATPTADTPATPTPPAAPVDVAAVLNGLAATQAERLDWQPTFRTTHASFE